MEGTFHTNSTAINHGVTLLGYHPDKGYLIKNTWGKIWGLLGYAYVSNTTGVCSFAYYPVLHEEKGAPILCSSHV
jgi:cathepsin H